MKKKVFSYFVLAITLLVIVTNISYTDFFKTENLSVNESEFLKEFKFAVVAMSSETADVSVSKESNVQKTAPGAEYSYIIKIKNNDEVESASDVSINDVLGEGLTAISIPNECVKNSNEVNCDIGILAPEEEKEIVITVKVDLEIEEGTILENEVTVQSAKDPDGSNDFASVQAPVVRGADVSVTKSNFSLVVGVGTFASYGIVVTNNDEFNEAENVKLIDSPGPGLNTNLSPFEEDNDDDNDFVLDVDDICPGFDDALDNDGGYH